MDYLKNIDKQIIDFNKVDDYMKGDYILKTITPIYDEPTINVYYINQDELDIFLEGYNQYAEFIVELRKVQKNDI